MSRTNPYKKKRRSAERTLLVYGEGLGEEVFLKYLRGLYSQNSGFKVKIRNGKGGTPTNIVMCAVNEPGSFDRKVVVLDNDKSDQEMNHARSEAKQRGIEFLENSPCLEATLLAILRPGQNFLGKTSEWCKSKFESNYMDEKKRTELEEYKKVFSKQILDNQKDSVSELKALINLMMGIK